MTTNVCDQFCYLVLTIPTTVGEQSQVLARSVVRSRYRAELAPIVFTRTGDNKLVFYKNDGKTPLDDPSDLNLDSEENPLLRYLQNSDGKSVEDSEEPMQALDDTFEDHITAVLGPNGKSPKRRKTNSSVVVDSSQTTKSQISTSEQSIYAISSKMCFRLRQLPWQQLPYIPYS